MQDVPTLAWTLWSTALESSWASSSHKGEARGNVSLGHDGKRALFPRPCCLTRPARLYTDREKGRATIWALSVICVRAGMHRQGARLGKVLAAEKGLLARVGANKLLEPEQSSGHT